MSKNVLPTLLRKHWIYFLCLSGSLLIACLCATPSQAKDRAAYRPFTLNRSLFTNLTHTLTQTNTIYMPLAANERPATVMPPTATAVITGTNGTAVATVPAATVPAATVPAATKTPTATPTSAATPTGAATPAIPGWKLDTFYPAGTLVTYRGGIYKCLQAHTSTLGWEPPLVVTLWQHVGTDPNTLTPTATATAQGMATATPKATTAAPTATAQATTTAPTATPPSQTATPVAPGANGWPSRIFAPYVDVTLYSPAYATGIGQKFYTLAFVVAANGTCRASSIGSGDLIKSLRAQGGNAIPAFGGASGLELAQACQTVEELQAQYQAVIDNYDFNYLDFDIEGAAVGEPTSIDRRNKAIANLQAAAAKAGKSLRISYTLPVWPSGLRETAISLLSNAIANGVDVSIVNIMTMDYGSVAPPPDKMGEHAISAANNLFAQLKKLYPAKTDAQIWGMIGLTPMIGLNDSKPEVFTLDDAKMVLDFAQKKQIGLLSIWSTGRDKGCPGGGVSPTCSGIAQEPWDFTKIFMPFTQ